MSEAPFLYEARGQVLVVHLPKELDHHNSRNLRYETDVLLAEHYISRIVFDFSKTEFMDSAGVGILLNRYKEMRGSGGSVAICGAKARIVRLLDMGGVTRLVSRYDTKEAAVAGREQK